MAVPDVFARYCPEYVPLLPAVCILCGSARTGQMGFCPSVTRQCFESCPLTAPLQPLLALMDSTLSEAAIPLAAALLMGQFVFLTRPPHLPTAKQLAYQVAQSRHGQCLNACAVSTRVPNCRSYEWATAPFRLVSRSYERYALGSDQGHYSPIF